MNYFSLCILCTLSITSAHAITNQIETAQHFLEYTSTESVAGSTILFSKNEASFTPSPMVLPSFDNAKAPASEFKFKKQNDVPSEILGEYQSQHHLEPTKILTNPH